MTLPQLETTRLRLEHFAPKNAAALLEYYARNREYLVPWEPARPEAFYVLEAQLRESERAVEAALRGSAYRFVAFERDSEYVVAYVSLHEIRRGIAQDAIVGYSVDELRQGRGYATEAVGAVVRFAFESLNLHRIRTSYQPPNAASGRVLEKLGFVREGYAREELFINGAWQDGVLVAMVNPRWSAP